MYSKKELTVKQHIFRELLKLISIEIILIFFGLGVKSLEPENITITASFALSIFINTDVIKLADYIIDVGPDGGTKGGQIVFTGTPEEMIKSGDTITARYLKK